MAQLGHNAVGLELHRPAIEITGQLFKYKGVSIKLAEGRVEEIPFGSENIDLVLAFSVMEHVINLEDSLFEINRVLKPGGVFWFNSASSLCPRQHEIKGFPLFGWYPDRIKRYIMNWVKEKRPHLVGYTKTPAIHWWTPKKAKRKLQEAEFSKIIDRWDLRKLEEDYELRRTLASIIKNSNYLRRLADMAIPGCSFAAVR